MGHYGCFKGYTEIVRILIGSAIFRVRNQAYNHYRSLRFASPEYNPEFQDASHYERKISFQALREYFRNLEDLRFNILSVEDSKGMTLLHYAIRDSYNGCLYTM